MANYYENTTHNENTTHFFGFAEREADRIEVAALDRATTAQFPPARTAKTSLKHYGVSPDKGHGIAWSANCDSADVPSREARRRRVSNAEAALLWTEKDWARKGGAIAFDWWMELPAKTVAAKLTIYGCVSPERFRRPRVAVLPFLGQRNAVERAKLSQLFIESRSDLSRAPRLGIYDANHISMNVEIKAR